MIHHPHLQGDPFFFAGRPVDGAQPDGKEYGVGILLVHGFTATVAEVRPLAELLHAAGYTTAGPLLPGHYTHPADLNRIHWQDWTAAVATAFENLAQKCDRVVVGGESTGGLLAMQLAASHPEISALLLYAPALRLNMRRRDVFRLRLLAPFVPWFPKPNLEPDGLWQGYTVNPLRGVIELLKLQAEVAPYLAKIGQPVLIIQGRLDQTIHPGVPDTIYNSVSSKTKERHWLEHSGHCVILDQERAQAAEITLRFLERCLPTILN